MRISYWSSDVCSSDLEVFPASERLGQRRLRRRALRLHLLEDRAFLELEADPQRHAEQDDRNQEGDAPAPVGERHLAHHRTNDDDAAERREQPERRSVEQTSELQSLMRISYTAFCLQKKS